MAMDDNPAATTSSVGGWRISLREILLVVLAIACLLAWWMATSRPSLTTFSSEIKHPTMGIVRHYKVVGQKLGWALEHRHQEGKWETIHRVEPSPYRETNLWIFESPGGQENINVVEIWHDQQKIYSGLRARMEPAGSFHGNHTIKSIGRRFLEIHWVDDKGVEQKHEFRVTE